jgi:hypothetical protein
MEEATDILEIGVSLIQFLIINYAIVIRDIKISYYPRKSIDLDKVVTCYILLIY